MIEPEDMELIQEFCAKMKARFYEEPRLSISNFNGKESHIEIKIRKHLDIIEWGKRKAKTQGDSTADAVSKGIEESINAELGRLGKNH